MTEKLKNLPTLKNQILKNVKIICSALNAIIFLLLYLDMYIYYKYNHAGN